MLVMGTALAECIAAGLEGSLCDLSCQWISGRKTPLLLLLCVAFDTTAAGPRGAKGLRCTPQT